MSYRCRLHLDCDYAIYSLQMEPKEKKNNTLNIYDKSDFHPFGRVNGRHSSILMKGAFHLLNLFSASEPLLVTASGIDAH